MKYDYQYLKLRSENVSLHALYILSRSPIEALISQAVIPIITMHHRSPNVITNLMRSQVAMHIAHERYALTFAIFSLA